MTYSSWLRMKDKLKSLKEKMESSSVLKFTYEININGTITFPDVDIKTPNGQFVSDVFRKTTNDCNILNAKSECPARYMSRVVSGGIRRAYKIYSSHELFEKQLKRFKQILINNGYTNTEFDQEVDRFLRNKD